MVKATLLLLAGGWVFCCTLSGAEESLPHVTVFGTATTEVVPDQMVWSVSVKNKASALSEAAKEHEAAVSNVLKFLKQQKLPDAKIQTAHMQFGENREYRNGSWVEEGYFASSEISFTLEDLELYTPMWMGLAKLSGVTVQPVRYDNSRRIEYQNETRKKAVMVARDKARGLADALGSTIGEPLLIEEDLWLNESWGRDPLGNNVRTEGESGMVQDQIAPGRIPIKVRVRVAFRLVKP